MIGKRVKVNYDADIPVITRPEIGLVINETEDHYIVFITQRKAMVVAPKEWVELADTW